MKSIKIQIDNRIEYRNEKNNYHREDGPALEYIAGSYNGRKYYYYDGKCHRLDGPAIIYNKIPTAEEWWVMGKRHRVGGPAYLSDYEKSWYKNNMCHRLNAPAQFLDSSYKGNFYHHNVGKYYYIFGKSV